MKSTMTSQRAAGRAALALIFVLLPSALTACSASGQTSKPAVGALKIVASTSVWGSVIEAIGGNRVEVTSIVSNPNQDPHSFEATVRDQAAVNGADLVFLTGNGYDSFMNKLLSASNQPTNHVVPLAPNDKFVRPLSKQKVNDPHVWYDFGIVAKAADEITARLSAADKADSKNFASGNQAFQSGLEALKKRLAKVSVKTVCSHVVLDGKQSCQTMPNYSNIFQPESVGLRMLASFAIDATPSSVRQAVMNGNDISVQDMAYVKTLFFGEMTKTGLAFGSTWPIDYLVLNAQVSSPQISQIIAWSKQTSMKVNILTFSETLPANKTYLSWMSDNVKQLEDTYGAPPTVNF